MPRSGPTRSQPGRLHDPVCEIVARKVMEIVASGTHDPNEIAKLAIDQLGLPDRSARAAPARSPNDLRNAPKGRGLKEGARRSDPLPAGNHERMAQTSKMMRKAEMRSRWNNLRDAAAGSEPVKRTDCRVGRTAFQMPARACRPVER